MKFKFKIQQYQTDAVQNTADIFLGQPNRANTQYRRDLGKRKEGTLDLKTDGEDDGYRNSDVELERRKATRKPPRRADTLGSASL